MPYLTWKSFEWSRDGLAIFEAIRVKGNVFFLDSSRHRGVLGRYSFLGFEPFLIFKEKADVNSLRRLKELLKRYKLTFVGPGVPFPAGAVGYFSYDLGLCLEKIKPAPQDSLGLPDIFFSFYDTVIAIDHWMKKLHIFSSGFPETRHFLAKRKAESRLKGCIRQLSRITKHPPQPIGGRKGKHPVLISNFSKEKYLQAVVQAKEHIKNGDIYQVNLSQRFTSLFKREAPDLYKSLRLASPSSFSAYFDCGDFQIISSSPERFLKSEGRRVFTRPMKGTRPRSISRKYDLRNKQDLLHSKKDKAELLMIVDLLRNDLGRVCEYGSVKVRAQRILETYSTVYQTTAAIEGTLHRDKDRIDLLRACFPGGSITGCPKIRSMQVINELEPARRGIYTGSLGYMGFNDTMDLNILIRTVLKKDDKIYFQVGGGIVADSKPENEYQETLAKAQGVFRAIGIKNEDLP